MNHPPGGVPPERVGWQGGEPVEAVRGPHGRRLLAGGLAILALLALINLPGTEANRLARSVPYLERLVTLSDFGSGSGSVRVLIWRAVPALVAERPLLGHGPEMMGYAFEQHYPPGLAYAENRTASADRAHNLLLEVLVSAGIVGFGALLWLLAAAGVGLARVVRPVLPPFPRREGGRGVRSLAAATLGGAVALLVEGMVGVPSASAYLLLWLYLGLGASMARGLDAGDPPCPHVPASTDLPVPPSAGGRVSSWLRLAASAGLLIAVVLGILRLSALPLLADVSAAEGSALAARGRYEDAVLAYRRAIALHPDAEYHLLVGQMATRAAEARPAPDAEGWLRQGEEALGQAEGLNPLELDVALAQGRLHQVRASLLDRSEDWDRAEASFRRALALSPNRSYVRNRYGATLAARHRHEEALAQYRISLALDPGYAATHGFMGDSLVATGRLREALDAYVEAKRLDPELVLVRINLAELYLMLGMPREAAAEYGEAVALSPGDRDLRARLEQVLRSAPAGPRTP